MKFAIVLLIVSIAASAAFQQPAIAVHHGHNDALSQSLAARRRKVVAETPVLTMAVVRKQIDNLTKENFAATLDALEPFFLNEAHVNFYTKCMRRIERNAKAVGATMPEKYAYDAVCTAKRRTKQDEYIKTKFPVVETAAE